MRYYFAPMEGLTDSIFRQLHNRYFPGLDQYYTPFLSPTVHRSLSVKEARELPAAEAAGCRCIPQILTRSAEDFLWLAGQCRDLGYEEVNLNLGCPSGTVTAKGKGAGMLRDPDSLDAFLYEIFSRTPIAVSVKTRIGYRHAEEFPAILEIFNRYPIRELTVHPRVREDFYQGAPDLETFCYALQNAKAPLCYNGNLCSLSQIRQFHEKFPEVEAVMLGRGLIGDPGMLTAGGTDADTLEHFCSDLLEQYTLAFGSARNAMFRLKENWRYLSCRFENSDKLFKKLRKAVDLNQYRSITREIFCTLPLRSALIPDW